MLLQLRAGRRRVTMTDTMNYWRAAAWTIGRDLGVQKLTMPDALEDDEQWYTYCEKDVEIIESAVCSTMKWWKEADLGTWRPTLGSLAFSC
jgi:hypothetical protein